MVNMDLSLLENFQKLVASSLQSIIEDLKIQFDNQREDLEDRIEILTTKTNEQGELIASMKEKLEESNFNENNFTKVSIISNLNKQIKQLQNENEDLRNCLNKNIPMNASLARTNSPTNEDETPEENQIHSEDTPIEKEATLEDESELQEIEHKGKTYYLIDDQLYNKKKDGSQGKKVVGKMVNGKPKLNKKKKKEDNN